MNTGTPGNHSLWFTKYLNPAGGNGIIYITIFEKHYSFVMLLYSERKNSHEKDFYINDDTAVDTDGSRMQG